MAALVILLVFYVIVIRIGFGLARVRASKRA
jgi:hypothetical protein